MNRRTFFKSLVAVAAVVLVPFPKLQTKTLTRALVLEYNEIAKGKGIKGAPRLLYCGRDFFEAFESECIALQRFSDATVLPSWRNLKFKNVTMIPLGPGWWHEFIV